MGNGGNPEWHTDDDLMPVASKEVLLKDIQVYALAAFRLATAPLLPFDWRALLQEFDATLAGLRQGGGDRFDFQPARDAVAALDAAAGALRGGGRCQAHRARPRRTTSRSRSRACWCR